VGNWARWTLALALLAGLALQSKVVAPRAHATSQEAATIGPTAHIRAPEPNHHWPNFEAYVYDAEWRIWTAGTATLRMQPGTGGEQRVYGTADSTGFVSLLYTVRDRFESSFDPKTFCTSHLLKHTEEGFRRRETNIHFDYAHGKAALDEKNLKSGESKHVENEIPSCATDVLTAVYYVGTLPLQPGMTYTFPLNDGNITQTVEVRAEAREQVKVPAGTFRTIRVQPTASSGVLKDRGKVWIWFSDDAARIPVQMRARMFWGTLTFRLQRIERPPQK
jgi:hypothetical protein